MLASLGRAIDDQGHGRNARAAAAYLDALDVARVSAHPDAPLVGWFAANRLLGLRSSVAGLWKKSREVVLRAIDHPGKLGWRARGELVEWWSLDGLPDEAAAASPAGAAGTAATPLIDLAARRYGCIESARFAGPFGHLAASDYRVHHEAERAGPWPPVFPRDPQRRGPPRVLGAERRGCQLSAVAPEGPGEGGATGGIFYVETFVDLPAEREMLVAVQGAYAILVDDVEVLTRDTKQWGIWPRFGVRLRLGPGRHRIVARVGGRDTSIRLLAPDGTPLGVATSADPTPPYSLVPPEVLPDPNPIEPFLTALGVPPQPAPKVARALGLRGAPRAERDVGDPIARYLAATIAHLEGQDDVSAVLIEPLVADPARATGPALAAQAVFLEKDPIFPASDGQDLVKDVRARAAEKDPELWYPPPLARARGGRQGRSVRDDPHDRGPRRPLPGGARPPEDARRDVLAARLARRARPHREGGRRALPGRRRGAGRAPPAPRRRRAHRAGRRRRRAHPGARPRRGDRAGAGDRSPRLRGGDQGAPAARLRPQGPQGHRRAHRRPA